MTVRYVGRSSRNLSIPKIPELPSESRLWRNVLGQCVRDIYDGDQTTRQEVFFWIASKDFETVCDYAEVHSDDIREELMALSALPNALAKKFGRMLREKIIE